MTDSFLPHVIFSNENYRAIRHSHYSHTTRGIITAVGTSLEDLNKAIKRIVDRYPECAYGTSVGEIKQNPETSEYEATIVHWGAD